MRAFDCNQNGDQACLTMWVAQLRGFYRLTTFSKKLGRFAEREKINCAVNWSSCLLNNKSEISPWSIFKKDPSLRLVQTGCVKRIQMEKILSTAFYAANYAGLNEPLTLYERWLLQFFADPNLNNKIMSFRNKGNFYNRL